MKKEKGIYVNIGLKSLGVKKIISNIKKKKPQIPLSISVAKTNSQDTVDPKKGIEDYVNCLKELNTEQIGDFYTINISCPNAFGGEPFSDPHKLSQLLEGISQLKITKPIFIKMPIHLKWEVMKELINITEKFKIDGVIVGNLLKTNQETGGISGKPTEKNANELISKIYKYTHGKLVIIGVGGVFSPLDAYEKIRRGASLVQLITGMIYEGPQLIGEINKQLVKYLQRDGYKNIQDAIGTSCAN